jgi:presenilin 1
MSSDSGEETQDSFESLKDAVSINTGDDDFDSEEKVPLEEVQESRDPSESDKPNVSTRFDHLSIEENASLITQILVPVCITMIFVIWIVKSIHLPWQDSISQAMVYNEKPDDDWPEKLKGALRNAGLFVAMMLVVTCIFVVCYKYRCLKFIFAWLGLSTVMLLGLFGGFLVYSILAALNIPMDYFTFSVIIWNQAIVGMVAVFWHAPMRVNQGYLIFISTIMAVVFTRLPEWTTWAVLAAIAVYDLFAVLCPGGPLRVLVETAQERDEAIPALIYSASIWMMMSNTDPHMSFSDSDQELKSNEDQDNQEDNEEGALKREEDSNSEDNIPGSGVKLGLGDFVFYSVLVGRAAMFDMLTVFTSFIGIVAGLFFTILLLALFRKALPALPISIFFGIVFFLITKFLLLSFVSNLAQSAVVI